MARTPDSTEKTFESLIEYCGENQRVCPNPQPWAKLYDMLPNKKRVGVGWEPPVPLILAAWWETPAFLKMLRLKEHIEWAYKHDCLDEVDRFLRDLREEEWHHLEELT